MVSTWMGDHLGTPGVVGIFLSVLELFCSVNMIIVIRSFSHKFSIIHSFSEPSLAGLLERITE